MQDCVKMELGKPKSLLPHQDTFLRQRTQSSTNACLMAYDPVVLFHIKVDPTSRIEQKINLGKNRIMTQKPQHLRFPRHDQVSPIAKVKTENMLPAPAGMMHSVDYSKTTTQDVYREKEKLFLTPAIRQNSHGSIGGTR